jgi:glutamate/tyrosine decarboxylase-like PLP-dependent enzyme
MSGNENPTWVARLYDNGNEFVGKSVGGASGAVMYAIGAHSRFNRSASRR